MWCYCSSVHTQKNENPNTNQKERSNGSITQFAHASIFLEKKYGQFMVYFLSALKTKPKIFKAKFRIEKKNRLSVAFS